MEKHTKQCGRFLLAFFLCLFLGGCALPWENSQEMPITMPTDMARAELETSTSIPVDVYWDATVSMQGYTTLAAGNVYRTLPDLLGDIGDSMGNVQFFRFGAEVMPLGGREYRKFSDASTYTELITAVHNAVDTADPNHLSVIVTDLFESDSDWSNVTKKLKDKYFAHHLSVAVIGIKNSFHGDIFDVGLNARKYFYNSNDDPARFRPFYLILMGPEKKILEFIDLWKERQTIPNETQYLLLTENLTEGANDFTQLVVSEGIQNLYSNESLGIRDKRIKEFGINDHSAPVVLPVRFDYQPLFGTCPLDMDHLKTAVQAFSLSENGEWEPLDTNDDPKVEVSRSSDAPDSWNVTLTFQPEQTIKPDAMNFIHVSVFPDAKGYRLPDWVRAWNMPNVDVAPDQFDGSKTVNLLHVMESLKSTALTASHPALVNMNIIIDER